MNEEVHARPQAYIVARHQHPAWKLLSAKRGPLVLSCLRGLPDQNLKEILFEDAQQMLADILAQHANNDEQLYRDILQREQGRLEQEFLPVEAVDQAVLDWCKSG